VPGGALGRNAGRVAFGPDPYVADWDNSLSTQLVAVVERFLRSDKVRITPPLFHQDDLRRCLVYPLDADGRAQAKERYRLLMVHYGLEATTNNLGVAHENGEVEQEHRQFKRAVDQALWVRGSCDFGDRAAYARFLQNLVKQRNLIRQTRWIEEREGLRPLPSAPLGLCREVRVPVSRFSTIQVLLSTYSVPSRLIGTTLLIRVRSETLEVYRATTHACVSSSNTSRRRHSLTEVFSAQPASSNSR
jgi:hypothetical protein